MPIKLPKGFARRKSSGNILEIIETQPPAQSSFRVLDRRSNIPEGFGGGDKLRANTPDRSSGSSQSEKLHALNDDERGHVKR